MDLGWAWEAARLAFLALARLLEAGGMAPDNARLMAALLWATAFLLAGSVRRLRRPAAAALALAIALVLLASFV